MRTITIITAIVAGNVLLSLLFCAFGMLELSFVPVAVCTMAGAVPLLCYQFER
jgi:hypothetical protein